MKKTEPNPNFCSMLGSIKRIKIEKVDDCIFCGKELEDFEKDSCDSCYRIMKSKYPKTKCLEGQIKCHKRNAKKLKQ